MTKEKFNAYNEVREGGLTNMFDIQTVIISSEGRLTKEDCLDIMQNYGRYDEEYNN